MDRLAYLTEAEFPGFDGLGRFAGVLWWLVGDQAGAGVVGVAPAYRGVGEFKVTVADGERQRVGGRRGGGWVRTAPMAWDCIQEEIQTESSSVAAE